MDEHLSVSQVRGIGEATARALGRLDIFTVDDLLRFYPRTYEDCSAPLEVASAPIGENCCIKAKISAPASSQRLPGNRLLVKTTVTDGLFDLRLTFFNNKYIAEKLIEGREYLFYGKIIINRYGEREMLSPRLLPVDSSGLRAVYHQTQALKSHILSRCIKNALEGVKDTLEETLPSYLLKKYKLEGLYSALCKIHFPRSPEDLAAAKRRLVFEELLFLQLGLFGMREEDRGSTSCRMCLDFSREFFSLLPFEPTAAQRRAVAEALADMALSRPMNRLLQGDVGSGKTAVAAALIYSAAKNGFQSALMAPTEVLAEQHYKGLCSLFKNTGTRIALLTGSVSAKEKREIKAALADGEISLAVGTHALLSDDVSFSRLGLVITDEQHRFGVRQRTKLYEKGKNPHTLVMSATPIPRTLALAIYGDLDVSVLDELPPGRQPVRTFKVDSSYSERLFGFIRQHLDLGRQTIIVCPLVEEGELQRASAEELYKELCQGELKGYRVGLLHGKMKNSQKTQEMARFADGETQVLIATTVVEVGIDVPNADIIVIENAECFGLSQLHQLRGRVGRGAGEAFCILVSDSSSAETTERLNVICRESDGFRIADEDLRLRGPGDFFGSRQHGLPELRIADMMGDSRIMYAAQSIAEEIIKADPQLLREENAKLKRGVGLLFESRPSNN